MLDYDETVSFGLDTSNSRTITTMLQSELQDDAHNEPLSPKEKKLHNRARLDYIKKELINRNFSNARKDQEGLANYFRSKLKQNPFDPDLTLSLGNCLIKLGQIDRVKRLYSRYDRKNENATLILLRLADIFLEEESFKNAEYYYQQVLDLGTGLSQGQIYVKLAYCYHKLGAFKRGSKFANLALKDKTPTMMPEICFLFGNLHLGAKDYRGAVREYQKGLRNLESYSIAIKKIITSSTTNQKICVKSFNLALNLASPKKLEPKILNNLGNALNKLGKYTSAKKCLEKALSLNKCAYAYNNLALALKALGNSRDALVNLYHANAMDRNSPLINYNIAETHLVLGNTVQATIHFEKTLELEKNNESAAFKLKLLLGEPINIAPKEYVSDLFNKYAETFDRHLISVLKYKVPNEIHRDILRAYGKSTSLGRVLDLGCGTGLCGFPLKGRCEELVGIDLSESMLIKASQKSAYTQLKNVEILKYLKESKSKFDLVLAGDVCIYFGSLNKLFRYCASVCKNGSRFIFSIETSHCADFTLNLTGRFSHNKNYISHLATKYRWRVDGEKGIDIRLEGEKRVQGLLFTLLKE